MLTQNDIIEKLNLLKELGFKKDGLFHFIFAGDRGGIGVEGRELHEAEPQREGLPGAFPAAAHGLDGRLPDPRELGFAVEVHGSSGVAVLEIFIH